MTDIYIPVAANSTNLLAILNNSYYSPLPLSSEHILFICPIVATILVVIIVAILVILHVVPCARICGLKSKGKAGIKNQDKATILAVTIISFNRIVLFTLFDGVALKFRSPCSDLKVAAICEFSNLIHDIPLALLIFDCIMGMCSIVLIIVAVLIHLLRFSIFKDKVKSKFIQNLKYYLLIITALCFIFSCLMHTPYITMAYLSDAHYATSILVYYMTILFVEFGMVQYVLRLYYDSRAGSHVQDKRKYCAAICATVLILILLLFLLYSVIISASFFYYYIPLINVVTDLPNEGVVVYQTALILIGAYITYKTLFRAQNKKKDVHVVSRQVKENEISQLRTKIKDLKLKAEEDHQTKIACLNKQIAILQKEIQLNHIESSIACIANESESVINQRRIAHLYKLWKKTFQELQDEIEKLNPGTEKNYLQNELLYHLNLLHELTEVEQVDFKPIEEDLDNELMTAKSESPLGFRIDVTDPLPSNRPHAPEQENHDANGGGSEAEPSSSPRTPLIQSNNNNEPENAGVELNQMGPQPSENSGSTITSQV